MESSQGMTATRVERTISDSLRSGVSLFCSSHPEVAAVFLFGSYGTPAEREKSDIDLALLFRPGQIPVLRREMQLTDELCRIFRRDDIDLVVLDKAPLFLSRRIVPEGAILYEDDYNDVNDREIYRLIPEGLRDIDIFLASINRGQGFLASTHCASLVG